nr:unnamed protein product [Digitaria exilis]
MASARSRARPLDTAKGRAAGAVAVGDSSRAVRCDGGGLSGSVPAAEPCVHAAHSITDSTHTTPGS